MTTKHQSRIGSKRHAPEGHEHRVLHLVAGDLDSLSDMELLLATLPLCATGRVFIEVPDAADVSTISAPPRMTVTWLVRAQRSGRPGTGEACAPGQALTRAVRGWSQEMLCPEMSEHSLGTPHVWLSANFDAVADCRDTLVDLGVAAEEIQTPSRFGLAAH